VVRGLVMLEAKVTVPRAQSKFLAATYPETLLRPNHEGVVPHPTEI